MINRECGNAGVSRLDWRLGEGALDRGARSTIATLFLAKTGRTISVRGRGPKWIECTCPG